VASVDVNAQAITGTVQRAGPGVYLDANKVGLLKRNETRCR